MRSVYKILQVVGFSDKTTRNNGILEHSNTGTLEYGNTGILEFLERT